VLLQLTEDSLIRKSRMSILRKTQLRLMFKDSVLSVACVFSWRKLMHVVKDLSLKIAQFWRKCFPLGNGLIIHKEKCKEIGAWREK